MKAAILTSPQPVSERPLQISDVADPQPGPAMFCCACAPAESAAPTSTSWKATCRRSSSDPRPSDRRRSRRRRRLSSPRRARRRFLARRHRRHLPVLQARPRKSLRRANLHRLFGRGRLRRIRPGPRRLCFPLPDALDDLHAAPLLCAGIIGFRSLRVAGVEPASASACLASVRRRIWPSRSCLRGSARSMFYPRKVPPRPGRVAGRDMGRQ